MLTAKENMREVIRGGKPDRFVNQFEAIALLFHPYLMTQPLLQRGMENVVNGWGVTNSFPANAPGAFPVHTPDKIVVKDIEEWKKYVKAPSLKFPQELWDTAKGMYDAVDGTKAYKAAFIAPGIFEQCHYLCSIEEALMNYMEYPDEMHDLIKYLTDWELELAEGICSHLHPDAIFHHDDWGSEQNSFLRPSIFEDFFLDSYKQIYGYYKSHGVELIFHHSDSYCANILPTMIEMGIDVWQGCMKSNDVPSLIKKYGGKIAFMGEIDNKQLHQGRCERHGALRQQVLHPLHHPGRTRLPVRRHLQGALGRHRQVQLRALWAQAGGHRGCPPSHEHHVLMP